MLTHCPRRGGQRELRIRVAHRDHCTSRRSDSSATPCLEGNLAPGNRRGGVMTSAFHAGSPGTACAEGELPCTGPT